MEDQVRMIQTALYNFPPVDKSDFFEKTIKCDFLKKTERVSQETDIESEPSEVTDILPRCCENENQTELLSEVYKAGSTRLLNSSPLAEIRTPMKKNTMLHIAAWYGNDEIVTIVIERAPKLLFTFNTNNDSVLHVAARGGHISTVEKLLASYANEERPDIKMAWSEYTQKLYEIGKYNEKVIMGNLLEFIKLKNVEGNTMLHEAMLCRDKSIGRDKIFKIFKTQDSSENPLSIYCHEYALDLVNHAKQSVLYLAVKNGDNDAVKLILDNCPKDEAKPKGLSPIVAAIMMRNQEMMKIILENKPTWIHSRDKHTRLPLHYAAFIGYREGVDLLLGKCKCCTIKRDKYGYFPIHLASYRGHVEVVKKLLEIEYCPYPTEMLDTLHEHNIFHMAAKKGNHEVIRYLLQSDQIGELDKIYMINQKDKEGNTPLHLAAKSCHPKTVFYLTWDERVDYGLVNQKKQTAFEVVNEISQLDSSSTRQQLTLTALNSAGAKPNFERRQSDSSSSKSEESNESKWKWRKVYSKSYEISPNDSELKWHEVDSKSNETGSNESEWKWHEVGSKSNETGLKSSKSDSKSNETGSESSKSGSKSNESKENFNNTAQYFFLTGSDTQYKDRVQTLILVSTLIITASVAACFAVPGEAEGKAHNLYHAMFHFFIFFITISLFSSISATIILFWATLGLTKLVTFTLKIVMPLLGIALISLTLAFMAGLYTVISQLSWLANLFLVMAVIFVVLVILLYIVLFLPSASTRKSMRYISYYPFLFLAWLAE
ncbi:ankyrin repeat-containing protein ITN1-like [Vicia villosa]|uniref:ankyrin repeat-containing protein ITN1-like n=1 Tax=Vicia villosa TaxID=3911 RepID=UPI00273BE274|nr:ankyrin repeat-containing protein ITN1-like [Vicia villosa]